MSYIAHALSSWKISYVLSAALCAVVFFAAGWLNTVTLFAYILLLLWWGVLVAPEAFLLWKSISESEGEWDMVFQSPSQLLNLTLKMAGIFLLFAAEGWFKWGGCITCFTLAHIHFYFVYGDEELLSTS